MRSPTTCSTECPCDDADASMSVDISSATPNSPTTTCGTVRELAALVVNDKALDMDVTGDASPTATICLPGDLDDYTGNKDSVNMSLTPGSAPALFVAPQVFEAMVPHMCLIKCSVKDTCVLMPKFHPPLGCPFTTAQGNVIHSDCTLLPWPSFKCGSFWTLLVRQVLSEQREGFPSLVALHTRAMSLQRFLVPFENHVRHKHDKVFLGVQQLRPPWQPPKVEIMDVHTQEAAGGWFHSLEIAGRILLHQLGKFMSSSSSITVKDTTSPCAKWCLDDLSWRFHKWWSVTHCVQLANAIVRDFFWPWITIKNVKVLSLFSCSPSLVNCHVAKEQFLLSGTAQMNVASYYEASLNWVVYCGYPSLNNSQPHSWILIIVGRLVQYGLEADALLRVISWLPVTFLQLFLGLFCVVQGYPSSIGFLTILHGEAAVQHHYTCTRVLTEAIRARWIYYHILQGNTHFSELKQWSCSHSILQPEFWFCTPGHILFICCALVQWKNPWTIRLVSLIFRFPCCHAERKYLYSRENFQWTIAWLFSCQRLEMTELTPWCSSELFPCIYVVTSCLLGAFHILTSSVVTLEGIYSTCSHYFEVQILDQICIMFSTSIILHAEELYHLRGLYSSCNQFLTEGAICFGSQHLEWKIPWYIAWLLVKPSCAHPNFGGTLIMHFPVETVGLHPTKVFCYCLLIQWPGVLICQRASFYATLQNAKHILGADIYGPNWQNNTKLKNPSCWNGWSFLLHIPEHFADPILLLGVLLLGRPVKFSGFDELKKFWDPGGVKLRLSETTFVLRPWDPGGSTWCRLEVKPNFKEGGLSATCLHQRADGPPPWSIACLEARCR